MIRVIRDMSRMVRNMFRLIRIVSRMVRIMFLALPGGGLHGCLAPVRSLLSHFAVQPLPEPGSMAVLILSPVFNVVSR
jgi:hypothetical protein